MRKNSIRKFVHAVLDLIPLFIIPIFAIYTRNENYNSNIEVEIKEDFVTNGFNQLFKIRNINYNGTFQNVTFNYDDISITLNGTNTGNTFPITIIPSDSFINGHKYYIGTFSNANTNYYNVNFNGNDTTITQETFIFPYANDGSMRLKIIANATFNNERVYFKVIDLTQIFGQGYEPTLQQCNIWFPNEYYLYSEGSDYIIKDYSTTTYNDTDVGSQFVYTLYNAIDKYFNMNNVFNMNDVYDWFVLNIFGGNAPLGLYIVWNIVLYEFVMDLLMLLYGVFMFFIDCCTKLIEKPLNAIK